MPCAMSTPVRTRTARLVLKAARPGTPRATRLVVQAVSGERPLSAGDLPKDFPAQRVELLGEQLRPGAETTRLHPFRHAHPLALHRVRVGHVHVEGPASCVGPDVDGNVELTRHGQHHGEDDAILSTVDVVAEQPAVHRPGLVIDHCFGADEVVRGDGPAPGVPEVGGRAADIRSTQNCPMPRGPGPHVAPAPAGGPLPRSSARRAR